MSYIRLNYLAALVLGVLSVPVASAQSVVFSGTNNTATGLPYTIPLQAASQVTVAPNGDVRLNCQLDGATGRCVGFPAGGVVNPGNAPTVSLASTAIGGQVAVGTAFNVNATLGNNPQSCLRTSTPSVAGWDGSVVPGLANATLSLSSAVAHTLSLKCFNDAGSGSGSVVVTGTGNGGGGGGNLACNADAPPPTTHTRDPLTQLANLPISSQAKAFKITSSKYLAMAFKPDNQFPGSSGVNFAGGSAFGVTLTYSAFYLSISECPGDFRPSVPAANTSDPTMTAACRMYVGTPEGDFMLVRFNGLGPNDHQCNLDPTKDYYVNIVLDNPANGLSPTSPDNCITTNCGYGLSIR